MIAEFNSYMSNIDIDFFKELCLKHGELRHYKKNEFILHEGDACSFFGFFSDAVSFSTVAADGAATVASGWVVSVSGMVV